MFPITILERFESLRDFGFCIDLEMKMGVEANEF
jgi:hypothetical protein